MLLKIFFAVLASFSMASSTYAFSLAKGSFILDLDNVIALNDALPGRRYFVFSPNDITLGGGFCASISGEELLESDNNLKNYGTCFINDLGTFEILELSENISGNYWDLKNSEYFIGEKTITLVL